MTIFSIIKTGLSATWRYQKVVWLLYLLTLIAAAAIAYPFHQLFANTVGHSMLLGDLVEGFNYTFLNDFKNTYLGAFATLFEQSIIAIGLVFLLLSFLTGGYLATLVEAPQRYDFVLFWKNCLVFGGRILRLSLFFMLLHGLLLSVYVFIFYQLTSGFSLFALDCEQTISFHFSWLTPVYILLASLVFMWQDCSKIILVSEQKKWVLSAAWSGLTFVVKNFAKTYTLYFIFMLLWAILVIGNYWISERIHIQDSRTIWLSFLLSQCFVLVRLYFKVWLAGSLVEWYEEKRIAN